MSSPKQTDLAEASEEPEYSLEDLDDLVMSKIMRKLKGLDRVYLTMASPSARRLCTGPNAERGVLGKLEIAFSNRRSKPIRLNTFEYCFDVSLVLHSALVQASDVDHLCAWLSCRARAFESVTFWSRSEAPSESETQAAHLSRLMPALASGGFCGPSAFDIKTLSKDDHALLAPMVQWETLMPGQAIELEASILNVDGLDQQLGGLGPLRLLYAKDFRGLTSPSTFASLGPSLTSLLIDIYEEPEGPIVFAPLPHLKELSLWTDDDGGYILPMIASTLDALAPSSASLRKLCLSRIALTDLPLMSALSALTALTSLEIAIDGLEFTEEMPSTLSPIVLPTLRALELKYWVNQGVDDGHTASPFPLLSSLSCPTLHTCTLDVRQMAATPIKLDVSHLLKLSHKLRELWLHINYHSGNRPIRWEFSPQMGDFEDPDPVVTMFLESLSFLKVEGCIRCDLPRTKTIRAEYRNAYDYAILQFGEREDLVEPSCSQAS